MSYDDQDFAEVVRDFSLGRYEGVEEMVTSRVGLDNVVQQGFEELIRNKDYHIKILVTPKAELLRSKSVL
ncbi:hypothetical protein N0V90_011293 [Kalmusia sp. IMI 367209]|nr:hypothetical protein N0V90_011293 [Kalmusia sp. IMI 367209]